MMAPSTTSSSIRAVRRPQWAVSAEPPPGRFAACSWPSRPGRGHGHGHRCGPSSCTQRDVRGCRPGASQRSAYVDPKSQVTLTPSQQLQLRTAITGAAARYTSRSSRSRRSPQPGEPGRGDRSRPPRGRVAGHLRDRDRFVQLLLRVPGQIDPWGRWAQLPPLPTRRTWATRPARCCNSPTRWPRWPPPANSPVASRFPARRRLAVGPRHHRPAWPPAAARRSAPSPCSEVSCWSAVARQPAWWLMDARRAASATPQRWRPCAARWTRTSRRSARRWTSRRSTCPTRAWAMRAALTCRRHSTLRGAKARPRP